MLHILLFVKRDLAGCIAANRVVYEVYGKNEKPQHKVTLLIGDRVRKSERENEHANMMIEFERDFFVDYLALLDASGQSATEVDAAWPRCLSFDSLAKRYGIHVETIKNANNEETVQKVAAMKPDVILNIRNNMIYKAPIIETARLGFMNTHLGPLPDYKGLYGVLQQMMHGEQQIGCALHVIDTGIDTGAIIGKRYIPLRKERSVIWHQLQLYLEGVEAFIELWPEFEKGIHANDLGKAQDPSEGRYFGQPEPHVFEAFDKKGFRMIVKEEMEEFTSKYFVRLGQVVKAVTERDSTQQHQYLEEELVAPLRRVEGLTAV